MTDIEHNLYQLGDIIVDCHAMTLSNQSDSIKLPVKVFEFFKLFLIDEQHTVSREHAIETIWDGNEGVGKRGYINAMWQIRKAFNDLGCDSDAIFKTLPKVGYVLQVAPVAIEKPKQEVTPAPAPIADVGFLRRNRLWLILGTMVVISSLAAWYFFQLSRDSASTTPEYQPLQVKRLTNFQGVEEQPSISRDGRFMAFHWKQENKTGQIYIKDLQDEEAPLRLLSLSSDQEVSPVWSGDDQAIAYLRITQDDTCQVRIHEIVTARDTLIDDQCYYRHFRRSLDWSHDNSKLYFAKKINGVTAIFEYDIATKNKTQLTFPAKGEVDSTPVISKTGRRLAFVREKAHSATVWVNYLTKDKSKQVIDSLSVSGLAWGTKSYNLIASVNKNGKYQLLSFNINTDEMVTLNPQETPSNIVVNPVTGDIIYAKHVSNEYILRRSFDNKAPISRVISAARNLYGRYVSSQDGVLFLSNRDESWNIWLSANHRSKQITFNKGTYWGIPAMSPDGDRYLVNAKHDGETNFALHLGSLADNTLVKLALPMVPEFPTWSRDTNTIFFSSVGEDGRKFYQYHLDSEQTELISEVNFQYVQEGPNGNLYGSREGMKGLWQFNRQSGELTLLTDALNKSDIAAFFWQDKKLYYLARTDSYNKIMRYQQGGDDILIDEYPAATIRSYYGITAADSDSFLLTLSGINDSDVYVLPANQ